MKSVVILAALVMSGCSQLPVWKASALDLASTDLALRQSGIKEANPIIRLGGSREGIMVVGSLLKAAGYTVAKRLPPADCRQVMRSLVATSVAAAANNTAIAAGASNEVGLALGLVVGVLQYRAKQKDEC